MPPQLTNYSSKGENIYAQFSKLITFEDIITIIKNNFHANSLSST
jgi:hypothetical protein